MLKDDVIMQQFAQEQIAYFQTYLKQNPNSKVKSKIESGIKQLQAYL